MLQKNQHAKAYLKHHSHFWNPILRKKIFLQNNKRKVWID
jgi:hypothetical protein